MNFLYIQNLFAKRFISVFFAFSVVLGSVSGTLLVKPNEVEAQFFHDAIHTAINAVAWAADAIAQASQTLSLLNIYIKDYILDPALWFVITLLIRSLTFSLLTWINSGFEGEPQFLLDKTVLFSLVIDENIRLLLYTVANFPELMDSLKVAVLQGIIGGFYTPVEQLLRSTFPGGNAAYTAYLQDFRACPSVSSWECYLEVSMSNNSYYGTQRRAMNELSRRLTDTISHKISDIAEGSGFISLTECVQRNAAGNCTRSIRKTPGQAVAGQLHQYLGSGLQKSIVADELLESITSILDALLNQFITQGLLYIAGGGQSSFGSAAPPPNPGSFVGAGADGFCNPRFQSVDPDCAPPAPPPPAQWCFTYTDFTGAPQTVCESAQASCNNTRNGFVSSGFSPTACAPATGV